MLFILRLFPHLFTLTHWPLYNDCIWKKERPSTEIWWTGEVTENCSPCGRCCWRGTWTSFKELFWRLQLQTKVVQVQHILNFLGYCFHQAIFKLKLWKFLYLWPIFRCRRSISYGTQVFHLGTEMVFGLWTFAEGS